MFVPINLIRTTRIRDASNSLLFRRREDVIVPALRIEMAGVDDDGPKVGIVHLAGDGRPAFKAGSVLFEQESRLTNTYFQAVAAPWHVEVDPRTAQSINLGEPLGAVAVTQTGTALFVGQDFSAGDSWWGGVDLATGREVAVNHLATQNALVFCNWRLVVPLRGDDRLVIDVQASSSALWTG